MNYIFKIVHIVECNDAKTYIYQNTQVKIDLNISGDLNIIVVYFLSLI